MTYQQTIRSSFLAIIIGVACLVIGIAIGRQTSIPVNGLGSANAQETPATSQSPLQP